MEASIREEQKEEERKEKECDQARAEERLPDDLWSWIWREWRKLLRIHLFIGGVTLLGVIFEPEHAWMFLTIWFLLALFSVGGRFGG